MYQKALNLFAIPYKAAEIAATNLMVWLNLTDVLERINTAKEVQLAQKVELLISNIKACNQYKELRACQDMFTILKIQYPEMTDEQITLINNCIDKKGQSIINKHQKTNNGR